MGQGSDRPGEETPRRHRASSAAETGREEPVLPRHALPSPAGCGGQPAQENHTPEASRCLLSLFSLCFPSQ